MSLVKFRRKKHVRTRHFLCISKYSIRFRTRIYFLPSNRRLHVGLSSQ
uniref:Uncharacterized protein n=1 Tax=Anguilla anguilla TaxID=7936 RepID=A0A0E9XJ58_ANGAN